MAGRWREDLGAWVSSLRFSGFTVLIVALLGAGALIVSPSLTTYIQQKREIAELRESVALHREAVSEAEAERLKWQDPVYIRSQARDRLFYVMPGETQLSVIDDVVIPVEVEAETSPDLLRTESDWARSLVGSVLVSGTTGASIEELGGEPAPGPEPAPEPSEDQPEPAPEENPE